jgi:hypothetical protein
LRHSADGSFGRGQYRGNVAITSLAALAFMSSGSTPERGRYAGEIGRALNYVLKCTSRSGLVTEAEVGTYGPMYSHGGGTL